MRLIFLFFSLCFAATLAAQKGYMHPSFHPFGISDGLPSLEVYDVVEDKDGYLWFGTDNGLCRFDGYVFETFTVRDGLPDNVVLDLQLVNDNRIWLTCLSGGRAIIEDGKIRPFDHNALIKSYQKAGRVGHSVFDERTSTYYQSLTGMGILEIDALTGLPQFHQPKQQSAVYLFERGSSFIYASISNELAIPKLENIPVLYDRGDTMEQVTLLKKNEIFIGAFLVGLDSVVVFTEQRMIMCVAGHKVFEVKMDNTALNSFAIDQVGNIWLCYRARKGVRCYKNWQAVAEAQFETLLQGYSVSNVLRSRSGIYWFCTSNAGVWMSINPDLQVIDQVSGLASNHTTSLATDGQRAVYLGLDNFMVYDADKEADSLRLLPIAIKDQTLFDMIWLPHAEQLAIGDLMFDPRNQSISQVGSASQSYYVRKYAPSTLPNKVWRVIGNHFRLVDYQLKTETDLPGLLNLPRNTGIAEDADGKIWIGTIDGLYRLDSTSQVEPTRYAAHKALSYRIEAIDFLTSGTPVIATKGEGLMMLYAGDSMVHITEHEGLLSNSIECMHIDREGSIWLGTKKGLNHVFRVGNKWQVNRITTQHGLPSNLIMDILSFQGKLWLATDKGTVVMSKMLTRANTQRPVLTYVTVNKVDYPLRFKQFELSPTDREITIHFQCIRPQMLGNIKYRYRLADNAEWQETYSTTIHLTSLKPADYQFEVQAQNEDAAWSQSESFEFSVAEVYYQTAWFTILLILTLGFWALAFVQRKLREAKIKTQAQAQLFDLERNALQAQMTPHFIFNCLNSIQNLIQKGNTDSAMFFLTGFSDLLRNILNFSARQSIQLDEERQMLQQYLDLEKLRHKDRFTFRIEVDSTLRHDQIELPPMLVQPFAENAVFHGLTKRPVPGGELLIRFEKADAFLRVIVQDNGIGFQTSVNQIHVSKGMSLVKRRLALWNDMPEYECFTSVTRPEFEGTRVTLLIKQD
jgi:ligand-binding sensor domain-containing protein